MALTRSVIDLHGGALEVQSTPGHGTRVHVRLPVGERTGEEVVTA
jgi:signal transduction histidine kinase